MPSPVSESPAVDTAEHVPSSFILSDDSPLAIDDATQERSSNLGGNDDKIRNPELKPEAKKRWASGNWIR